MTGKQPRDKNGRFLCRNDLKKPLMSEIKPLAVEGTYRSLSLDGFEEIIKDIIKRVSDRTMIDIDTLIFKSNSSTEWKNLSINQLSSFGIPILDYGMYLLLKKKEPNLKIEIEVDANLRSYTKDDLEKCIYYAYFMLMTRSKILTGPNEHIPGFITHYIGLTSNKEEIKRVLSFNNCDQFENKWIRKLKPLEYGSATTSRFKSGTAGSRLFNIFRDYKPKINMTSREIELVEVLRSIATDGPYWEMHPLFIPTELSGISMTKNLGNFILDVFEIDEIRNMVSNKALYKIPTKDEKHLAYKTWTLKEFRAIYKSKILE